MMKKLVSLLLAVAMLLTVLPAAALAADENDAELVSSAEETAEAKNASTPTAENLKQNQEGMLQPEESEIVQPQSELAVTYEEMEAAVEDMMLIMFDTNTLAEAAGKTKGGYVERHASDDLVAFIKVHENQVLERYYPMWDVAQWSIGYGSRCPNSPSYYKEPSTYTVEEFPSQDAYNSFMGYVNDGMSQEEATQLLESFLTDSFEPAVNNVARKYNIALTQSQFDALLDFSYALGAGWTSGSRMCTGLINNYHSNTWTLSNHLSNSGWYFINAMGTWCHVSGAANHGAATRRVQDLEIFAYGDYYDGYYEMRAAGAGHYTYLIFNANGGACVNPAGTEDWATTNRFYFVGSPYGSLMNATRDGYYFAGWYTEANGGTKITANTIAKMNTASNYYAGVTVYAHWSKTPVDPEIGSATDGSGYTDVPANAWYTEAVVQATQQGLFNGYPDGSFGPDDVLTRAMAVSVLYRLSGDTGEYPQGYQKFHDVPQDQFYTNAVGWALTNGIVNGVSDTEFAPNEKITREQLAKMMYGYAAYQGHSLNYGAPVGYTDFDQISNFAIQSVCWAVTHGIINGTSDTTLSPKSSTTRAQTATILIRYQEKFEN